MSIYNNGISQKTIDVAANSGFYSQQTLAYLQSTMNSYKPKDVVKHRGVQTRLRRTHNHSSPLYKKNCEVLHKYDNKNW